MKRVKRLLGALGLAVAVMISTVPVQVASGTQLVAQAATVKLNKKSVTLDVGKTQKLKVVGTKAKAKWSSTNTKVVKVSQTGTITAKTAGKATVVAKVGKKTLSCKVTVKEQFSATKATKNISVILQDTGAGVVAILKNNNKVNVSLEAKLVYYSNGKMIDTSSASNYAFESGRECALFFYAPTDSDFNKVSYDDYKITLSVEEGKNLVCDAKNINIESNIGAGNVTAEVTNNSNKNFAFEEIAVVFYDAGGNAIGYDYTFADCLKAGSVDYVSFDFPYDSEFETIYPSSYKIYVNSAYTYSWM